MVHMVLVCIQKLQHLDPFNAVLKISKLSVAWKYIFVKYGQYMACYIPLNCSAPNSAPTSSELSQCTAVWGSIIIHHPTTTLSTLLRDSHLLPRPTEKIQLLSPH